MTIWFVSDTHFGHNNIIRFCDRPFDTCYEMNEALINNWNNCVGSDDRIYHLGDFAFSGKVVELLKRLNGKKYFLAGNHDKSLFKRDSDFNIIIKELVVPHVQWIKDYYEMTIQDSSLKHKQQMIVFGHYSHRVWNKSHHGSWNLYGHSHGSLSDDSNALSIDVGVDAVARRYAVNGVINKNDYRPICYDEIKAIMKNKQFLPIDHHGSN